MTTTDPKEKIDYSYSFIAKPRFFIIITLLFFATLVLYIPFEKKIDSFVYSSLSSIRGCPIGLESYHLELFSPKIILKNLDIDGRCFGRSNTSIKLKTTSLYFRGISFSPLGLSFKLKTLLLQNEIEVFIIPGLTSLSFLIESASKKGQFLSSTNRINLSTLKSFIPKVKVNGDINISTAHIKIGYNGLLEDITLNLASKNLSIPPQKINMLLPITLPTKISINSLLLQITSLDNGTTHLKSLIIGDEKSPIIANFKGDIELNQKNPNSSRLHLKGELGLSKKFIKDFAFLTFILNRFDKKGKFYQIQVKGNVGSLGPKSFTSPR